METNLKLNLLHLESEEKFLKDEWKLKKNEVHFLLMEGVLGRVDASSIMGQIGKINKLLGDDPKR